MSQTKQPFKNHFVPKQTPRNLKMMAFKMLSPFKCGSLGYLALRFQGVTFHDFMAFDSTRVWQETELKMSGKVYLDVPRKLVKMLGSRL